MTEIMPVPRNLSFTVLPAGGLPSFLILSNEGCGRCERCTYPTAECRKPERLFPSLEGFGIHVAKLAESAKVKYINGENTVTYFGMLLFDPAERRSEA